MTKRALEKSTPTQMYLMLMSEKTQTPIALPVLKKGNAVRFEINVPYVPRFAGYSPSKQPKPDVIRIEYVTTVGDGKFSAPKKMGEYDFSTMDLEEILPSQELAKLSNPSDYPKEEEEDDDEEEEDADSDDDESDASSESSEDDPKDADYKEMNPTERIAACTEDVVYWRPEGGLWEFKFPVIRSPPHLQLSQVNFTIVKKKKL
jgi:hypothetical protein